MSINVYGVAAGPAHTKDSFIPFHICWPEKKSSASEADSSELQVKSLAASLAGKYMCFGVQAFLIYIESILNLERETERKALDFL